MAQQAQAVVVGADHKMSTTSRAEHRDRSVPPRQHPRRDCFDPEALRHLALAQLLRCALTPAKAEPRLLIARDDDCVGAHKIFRVSQMRVSQEASADVQMCGDRCLHHA